MMKLVPLFLAGVLVIPFSVGCGQKQSTTKGPDNKELSLTPPGSTTIKQGETAKVTVKIERKNFDEPVEIKFTDLPEKVKVENANAKIEKGATEVEYVLKADADATPVENHKAKVQASGGGMTNGPREFTLNVAKK